MTDDPSRPLFEGPKTLTLAQRDIPLDPFALEAARRFLEDRLVEMRDTRWSADPRRGNGLVIREADGTDSAVIRLSTHDALMLGVRAYLASLGDQS